MKLWNCVKKAMLEHLTSTIGEEKNAMSFEDVMIWAEAFSEKIIHLNSCAILCRAEMATSMALLSCFAAGVTAIPLSVRYGMGHIEKILRNIMPDAIIIDFSGSLQVIEMSEKKYEIPNKHPALIMCTSGTTGEPKGIMLSEDNIISNVSDICEYFDITKEDTILISRPLYHCAVLTGEFLTSLIKGTSVVFYSGEFSPAKMPRLIQKNHATVFCGTPTLLTLMARFVKSASLSMLKHICVSGECMGKETGENISKAFPHCRIYHVYGLTEACPRVSYLPPEHFTHFPDCVGVPLRSVEIKLVDRHGKKCTQGEEGVIFVKGNNIMLGYYKNPQKTKEVMQDGWLCTGDVGIINEQGFLKIKGRRDNLIIKAGMNIYPAEIEEALKKDDRVEEVMAYAISTAYGSGIGLKIAGEFASVDEVRLLCRAKLPTYQMPSHIDLLDFLPKNVSGKLKRSAEHGRA